VSKGKNDHLRPHCVRICTESI